jgi:hypothetical protein
LLAPNDRTPANYASFLKTKLEDPGKGRGQPLTYGFVNSNGSTSSDGICRRGPPYDGAWRSSE